MDASEEHSSLSRYGNRVKALGNQGGKCSGAWSRVTEAKQEQVERSKTYF